MQGKNSEQLQNLDQLESSQHIGMADFPLTQKNKAFFLEINNKA